MRTGDKGISCAVKTQPELTSFWMPETPMNLRSFAIQNLLESVACKHQDCSGANGFCRNDCCVSRTLKVNKDVFGTPHLVGYTEAEIRGLYVHGDDTVRRLLVPFYPADVVEIALFHTSCTELLGAIWEVWVKHRTEWDVSGDAKRTAELFAARGFMDTNSFVKYHAAKSGYVPWTLVEKPGESEFDWYEVHRKLRWCIEFSHDPAPEWVFNYLSENSKMWGAAMEALQRPECPETVFDMLVWRLSTELAVAQSVNCPQRLLKVRPKHSRLSSGTCRRIDEWNTALAGNSSTSTEQLIELFGMYTRKLKSGRVTKRPGKRPAILLRALASNPSVASETLSVLHGLNVEQIGSFVAANPSCSPSIRAFHNL